MSAKVNVRRVPLLLFLSLPNKFVLLLVWISNSPWSIRKSLPAKSKLTPSFDHIPNDFFSIFRDFVQNFILPCMPSQLQLSIAASFHTTSVTSEICSIDVSFAKPLFAFLQWNWSRFWNYMKNSIKIIKTHMRLSEWNLVKFNIRQTLNPEGPLSRSYM